MSNFAEDYIPVNERIAAFYVKHPEGSLQSELIELSESRVVIRAYAYRTPADERPGIGLSSLEIPGKTPYTRGSEIENCETSAWGRAIAALGFEVKRGVASAEEVKSKQSTEPPPASSPAKAAKAPRSAPKSAPPPAPTGEPDDDDAIWAATMEALAEGKPAKPKPLPPLTEPSCPDHGTERIREAKAGHHYCATKLPNGAWCDWSDRK